MQGLILVPMGIKSQASYIALAKTKQKTLRERFKKEGPLQTKQGPAVHYADYIENKSEREEDKK